MRQLGFHWTSLAAASALLATALGAAEISPPPSSPAAPQSQNDSAHVLLDRRSPVEKFRALLAMTPWERERALANKSLSDRAILLAKLQEYESLPPGIREARLCQTELHWELSDLMKLAPANRTNRLKEVSPLYRPMLEGLLRQWDAVPAATQKALMEKQSFISVYLRVQGSPAAEQQEILDKLPPERRARWAQEMGRWQALPEGQRAELCAQFQRFCALNAPEQKKTVDALSDAERQEMEKALQSFNRLPSAQRTLCINSFSKFATMAPGERAQFLKNAARWEAMTSDERQLWRELVHTLPPMPPMPPMPVGLPPMPPGFPGLPPNVTAPVIMAQQGTNDVR